eukprot:2651666-Pyramimonas_sp.AAC.1
MAMRARGFEEVIFVDDLNAFKDIDNSISDQVARAILAQAILAQGSSCCGTSSEAIIACRRG